VQIATFGRLLPGHADAIVGFAPSSVRIDDPVVAASLGGSDHVNVVYDGRDDSRVTGTVFEVTEGELASADAYEREASYRRVVATLASGAQAWVYQHEGPQAVMPPGPSRSS
jgi:gamma-glutamylcyclotransferase (GGCT)/AIG2-like uncharacterized protein YtfP